jgi:hypothetical protein
MNRLFGLGHSEPILERDFTYLTPEELTVWNDDHPEPKKGITFEAEFLAAWQADVEKQLRSNPDLVREGWLGTLSAANHLAREVAQKDATYFTNRSGKVVCELSKAVTGPDKVTLCIALSDDPTNAIPRGALRIDTEDIYGLDSGAVQSLVKNPRLSASYTYCYNPPLAVRRLASLLGTLDRLAESGATIELTGTESTVWMVPAVKLLRPESEMTFDTRGLTYDFTANSIRDQRFLPGAGRYLGFTGLMRSAGMNN